METAQGAAVAPRLSGFALTAVIVAHAVVFALLLHVAPGDPPVAPAVLSVSLLAPEPAPSVVPQAAASTPVAARLPLPHPTLRPLVPVQPLPAEAAAHQVPAPAVSSAPAAIAPESVAATATVTAAPAGPAVPAPPSPSASTASPPRFDAEYLDNPKPLYPVIARRMREEGRVVLRVRVAASGLPTDVELHAGSGSPRLDQAALDTVRRWKFVPARHGAVAVAATVLVPIAFSLND